MSFQADLGNEVFPFVEILIQVIALGKRRIDELLPVFDESLKRRAAQVVERL